MEKHKIHKHKNYQTLSKSWKTEKYLENEKYQKHKNIENIGWGERRQVKTPRYPNPNTPKTRKIHTINLSYCYTL